MNHNDAKPDSNTIAYWKKLTDGNHHKNVRIKIGEWARKNSKNVDVNPIYDYLTTKIVNIYDRAIVDHGFECEDLESACMLTNVLLATIEQEYGTETMELISSTL